MNNKFDTSSISRFYRICSSRDREAPLKHWLWRNLVRSPNNSAPEKGAAPFKHRFMTTQLETNLNDAPQRVYSLAAIVTRLDAAEMPQRDYTVTAMATRFEPAEMPSGRRTFHRLSLSSTLSRMDASPGGYSVG